MSDSGRRRGSMWDVEVENQRPTSRGRYHEYSVSEMDNSSRPKDHTRWSSWEDKAAGLAKEQRDIAETRERVDRNIYYKNMSPGLDGLGQQNWRHSPDNRWSQSRRYSGRGKSRSRSRSRSKGRAWSRGRNRSQSRSWSRGRNKVRGRSRSRSRSRGSAGGHTRSRSPFYDQSRESHGWSDRRSESSRLSLTCRDFAIGMCRRGSQCRFLHSDNDDRRDIHSLETGQGGRWKSKPEPERGSRYSYDRPRDKFCDGEDEPSRNRSRSTIPCKDFMKGDCRFGAACRFSHHNPSQKDNYERGFRNAHTDADHEQRRNKSEKVLCKFFLAGNCQRNNCRFSHEGSTSNDVEDRSRGNDASLSATDWNKWSNPPTWDDREKLSIMRSESRWNEDDLPDMDLSEEFSIDRRRDSRWNHNFATERKVLRNDDKHNRDKYHTFYGGDPNSGVDMGSAKPVVENSFGEQENMVSQNFQSQNADGFSPRHIQNLGGEASSNYLSNSHRKVLSINSDISQYQGLAEHNRVVVFGSDPLCEVKDSGNTNGKTVNLDSRSTFSEHSSLLSGVSQGHHLRSPISNAHDVDLNEPAQHMGSPIRSYNEERRHQQEVPTAEIRGNNAPYSFPTTLSNEQLVQMTTPRPHLSQDFVDEFRPQVHEISDFPTSASVATSRNIAHPSLTIYTQKLVDSVRCLDQCNPVNNGTDHVDPSNNNPPPANLSYSNGQENQNLVELKSSLSTINPEFGKLPQSGSSGVAGHNVENFNENETIEKAEENNNGRTVEVTSKSGQENILSETADVQGKNEGGNSIKDEKGLRLFKNALVELVKDILKPTWKEGRMSRDVHKTIVKKVVDKVTSSVQAEHIPKAQDKIEQYLSSSKPKITKLVQAYVDRSQKAES